MRKLKLLWAPVLAFFLCIGILATSAPKAYAALDSTAKSLLNNAELSPVRTGYAPLDRAVDDVFKKLFRDNMDPYSKIKAVYDYMIVNYAGGSASSYTGKRAPTAPDITVNYSLGKLPSYSSTTDSNIARRALTIIETHRGSCLEFGSAFVVFAKAIGFEAYRMYGSTASASGGWGQHYWPVIKLAGSYYAFDPQVDDHIAGGGTIRYWRFCLSQKEANSVLSLASPIASQVKEHNNFDQPKDTGVRLVSLSTNEQNPTVNNTHSLCVKIENPRNTAVDYSFFYAKGGAQNVKSLPEWQTIARNSTSPSADWTPEEPGAYTIKATVKSQSSQTLLGTLTMDVYVKAASLKADTVLGLVNMPIHLQMQADMQGDVLFDFSYTLSGGKKQTLLTDSKTNRITFTPKLPGEYLFTANVKNKAGSIATATLPIEVRKDVLMGDLDADGAVTAIDARMAIQASAKILQFSAAQATAADADRDGTVTANDARTILRASAGLERIS